MRTTADPPRGHARSVSPGAGAAGTRGALAVAPWGRATVLVQLGLFLVPAVTTWRSTLSATSLVPVVALPATLVVGIALLVSRDWRPAGGRIVAGTLVAAVLEVVLTVALVIAYSDAHPGWDLS